ncbi:Sporulation related domain-containing protein [Tropicimonas isoalkanivorans]|uniref:Sporulation related domain-containing protein n=2 Tax=Tropicimonas isoalkanivorans TaxID=441112 RepID=A0A1I1IDC6_9RHOB|nr:Sporulation related domain-containing protein [Tropicimonas isoalkanivorans]
MMNPAVGQGREALQAPYVQQYIQSGHEAGAYNVSAAGRARLIAQATGALVSLAVISAGAWWGYKQIMRDLHGVPVVQALQGPMRAAPEDPGGMVASYSGYSVNTVQAAGTAATPESELILAPDPMSLAEEDLPTAELKPVTEAKAPLAPEPEELDLMAQEEADDAVLVSPEPQAPTLASLTQDLPGDDPVARAMSLAETAAQGATPLQAPLPEADGDVVADEVAPEADETEEAAPFDMASAIEAAVRTAAVSVPLDTVNDGSGLAASPRPAPRPGGRAVVTLAAAEAVEAVPMSAPASADPAAIVAGTRLVQLGAYDTPAEAEAAWGRIATGFGGLMEDKTRVIVEAQAGGRDFWRLRAMGFDDLAEARRFCSELISENTECIPVVAR